MSFEHLTYHYLRKITKHYPFIRYAPKFSRAIGWSMRTHKHGPVWTLSQSFHKCPSLILDLSNRLQRKTFLFPKAYANYYLDGPLSHLMRHRLKPGHVFLDIGSNLGWFALFAAQLTKPSGRVITFEPDPISHESIIRSVQFNQLEAQITALQLALSNQEDKLAFYRDPRGIQSSLVPESNFSETFTVPVTSLDALFSNSILRNIDRIDLIKIDVEGNEPKTIQGMLTTLNHFQPDIWCEVRGPYGSIRAPDTLTPVREMLEAIGYAPLKYNMHKGTFRHLMEEDISALKSQDVFFSKISLIVQQGLTDSCEANTNR